MRRVLRWLAAPHRGRRLAGRLLRTDRARAVLRTPEVLAVLAQLPELAPPEPAPEPEPEPEPELEPAPEPRVRGSVIDRQHVPVEGLIDVRDLLRTLTVEEQAEAADEYFRKVLGERGEGDWYFRAKPFTTYDEAADHVISFANVLLGVRPLKGHRVLDFGAGTGWTSRILAQMGCEVIACDVSPTALEFARRHFKEVPMAAGQKAPELLLFDGRRLDLPDDSIDRVTCIDAFHHISNRAEVLNEMARVLRPGGIAGFQEPGPDHSKMPQSQFEMRNYTVIENDVLMTEIWSEAEAAGFESLQLAVFTAQPFHVDLDGYEDFLEAGPTAQAYGDHVRTFAASRRIFFLRMPGEDPPDSRERAGLLADLDVAVAYEPSERRVVGTATATNTGTSRWLPSSAPRGRVLLGVHLYGADGALIDRDFGRAVLPDELPVEPGSTVTIPVELPVDLPSGAYRLVFDLVAEGVAWFELNNCEVCELPIVVD